MPFNVIKVLQMTKRKCNKTNDKIYVKSGSFHYKNTSRLLNSTKVAKSELI